MFSHYHEVRAGLESVRTGTPTPESLRQEVNTSEPVKARDSLEYRKAFVGDVQLYLRKLEWWEAYILLARMVKPWEEQVTWYGIAKHLKRVGHDYPRSFRDGSNIARTYRNVIKPLAEDHFRDRGYLR
jgi:hypothetical protein